MSQLLYKLFLNKTNLDSIIKVGDAEDPYFEEIPDEDLHFYQRKGARRKRRLPGFIANHDLKVLNSVKRKAYRLDLMFSLCGIRFGWAGVMGLIPWIGDIFATFLALQIVRKAEQVEGGLPAALRLKMMANVIFDFLIGLIPIVGDFINIAYKCNLRNFVLLEKHLVEKYLHGAIAVPGKSHSKSKGNQVDAQEVLPGGPDRGKAPQTMGYYDDPNRV